MLRLDTNLVDYAILAIYFAFVLGIGFVAKRTIRTSLDYSLSGRSLPARITGLAFVSANEAEAEDDSEGVGYRSPKVLASSILGLTAFLSLGFI